MRDDRLEGGGRVYAWGGDGESRSGVALLSSLIENCVSCSHPLLLEDPLGELFAH